MGGNASVTSTGQDLHATSLYVQGTSRASLPTATAMGCVMEPPVRPRAHAILAGPDLIVRLVFVLDLSARMVDNAA